MYNKRWERKVPVASDGQWSGVSLNGNWRLEKYSPQIKWPIIWHGFNLHLSVKMTKTNDSVTWDSFCYLFYTYFDFFLHLLSCSLSFSLSLSLSLHLIYWLLLLSSLHLNDFNGLWCTFRYPNYLASWCNCANLCVCAYVFTCACCVSLQGKTTRREK